jgi:ribosomal protein S18 acetylase RimI-like enzyme
MRIEIASIEDADTLARLNQHVHRLHVESVPNFFKWPTHEEALASFRELLGRDNSRAFIAYEDDVAIGYLLVSTYEHPADALRLARRFLDIDQISVEPNWQRRGVGRELMNAALQYARETGISDIELSTWAFNSAAQAFFKSLGFQPKTERFWMRLEA